MNKMTPFRRLACVSLMLVSLAACGKSEPVYTSISAIGRNYLPYNLSGFTVSDQFGNKVSVGGDLAPGGGGGSVSCCYALKGTQFDVSWSYYDADQWHAGDEKTFHATAKATLPATQQPEKIGDRILQVHFYPDHHVELQFPAGIMDPSQLPVVDVARAMFMKHQDALDKRYDDTSGESLRRISRVVAQAWLKYRLSDERDLEQYTYYALLVNPQFDAHPAVQKLIQDDKTKPGALAAALDALPASVKKQLKGGHFATVPVPSVPDGLLPPPRETYDHAG
ncbi:hypothetical protein [Paraburkholderia tropica]|uniref:hypothetical protein n=1 Tax=Paraburkholderia TaxID=1822464 RepID=UPI002AB7569E|nr:hypothetical protein [Paraburkholderia tropica]